MKEQTTTIEQIQYISDDGKIFTNKYDCEVYEKKEDYEKAVEKLPHVQNVLFFNSIIDGFFCSSQEDIDNCCKWWNNNYFSIDKKCATIGKFTTPDLYLIVPDYNFADTFHFIMTPLFNLSVQWDLFKQQIPKLDGDKFEDNHDALVEDIYAEFLSVMDLENNFKRFLKNKLQSIYDNTNISELTPEEQDKFYTEFLPVYNQFMNDDADVKDIVQKNTESTDIN